MFKKVISFHLQAVLDKLIGRHIERTAAHQHDTIHGFQPLQQTFDEVQTPLLPLPLQLCSQ